MAKTQAGGSLADEREHLLASIRDLDAEHRAGEISDGDYESLRSEYVTRAAAALRAEKVRTLTAPSPAPTKQWVRLRRFLGRRTTRQWMGVALAVSFAGVGTLLALIFAGVRLPGEGVSGGVTLNQAQQIRRDLDQAQVLGSTGHVSDALNLYNQVLGLDPAQPEALTYRGYLLCLTAAATKSPALLGVGRTSIQEAIKADPTYGDAHFFFAVVLLDYYGQHGRAAAQFSEAFRDHVSPDLVTAERLTIAQLFRSLHKAVPSAVAGA